MNRVICLLTFFISFLLPLSSYAQFNVLEHDGSNRLKVLGSEWAPSFFSLASTETDKIHTEGGRISTYNYFTFATYLDDFRFALRLPFVYSTAGTDRFNSQKQNAQQFQFEDIMLCLQSHDMWLIPWDIGSYWEGRVYLPTSQFSRETGLISRLRNEFIFTKLFNRWLGIEYDQQFSYFLQSRTVYSTQFQDENGFPVDTVSVTKQMELNHWLDLFAKVNSSLSIGWELGERDTSWNRSAAENKSKPSQHLIRTGPQIRFPIGTGANFIFSYQDEVDRDNNRSEFGRFLAKNTSFALLSFVHF